MRHIAAGFSTGFPHSAAGRGLEAEPDAREQVELSSRELDLDLDRARRLRGFRRAPDTGEAREEGSEMAADDLLQVATRADPGLTPSAGSALPLSL